MEDLLGVADNPNLLFPFLNLLLCWPPEPQNYIPGVCKLRVTLAAVADQKQQQQKTSEEDNVSHTVQLAGPERSVVSRLVRIQAIGNSPSGQGFQSCHEFERRKSGGSPRGSFCGTSMEVEQSTSVNIPLAITW